MDCAVVVAGSDEFDALSAVAVFKSVVGFPKLKVVGGSEEVVVVVATVAGAKKLGAEVVGTLEVPNWNDGALVVGAGKELSVVVVLATVVVVGDLNWMLDKAVAPSFGAENENPPRTGTSDVTGFAEESSF